MTMPESRDRGSRRVDIHAAYVQRLARRQIGSLGVLIEDSETEAELFGSPARQRAVAAAPVTTRRPAGFGATGSGGGGGGLTRSSFGTPTGNGRTRFASGLSTPARENTPVGGSRRRRGRASGSLLPSWYPRTPLRDITAVVRAIERRRARLRENDDQTVIDQTLPVSNAQLEIDVPAASPISAVRNKPCPPASVRKVHKILRDVVNQPAEGEFLTPQKKLLNSIDTVEKVVMEELQRLKRTPSAKKAEREKRVRTLMSMR